MLHLHPSESLIVLVFGNRSSYPDRKEGEDAEMDEEELPDDKTLEYDDETLELTLPSGDTTCYYNQQNTKAERTVNKSTEYRKN